MATKTKKKPTTGQRIAKRVLPCINISGQISVWIPGVKHRRPGNIPICVYHDSEGHTDKQQLAHLRRMLARYIDAVVKAKN